MAVLEMLGKFFSSSGIVTWLMLLMCISLAYWYTTRQQAISRLPPGPPALPILGSLPFFKSSDIVETLRHFQQKYGDVFTMDLGMRRVVVLNSYPVIKEALVKNATATSGRSPESMGLQFRAEKGLVVTNGDTWVEQRRYTLHTLRDFGLGKNPMERFISAELDSLLAVMELHCGTPYRPKEDLQFAAANVVSSFAFGRTMERDNPSFLSMLGSIRAYLASASSGALLIMFPILRYIPFFDVTRYKEVLGHTMSVIGSIKGWIEEAKVDIQSSGDSDSPDLIHSYLKEIEKNRDDTGSHFSEEQLQWIIFDLYFGGVETTATTISWLTLYLILNPEVQSKVHQELDEVVGQSRRPVMMDKTKLPYCEAVLNEVMRLVDLAPIVSRTVLEDFNLRGHNIPAGTSIIANMNSCHHDPKIFPESERFDPTRFLDENGKFKKNEALNPFSIGRRSCVGESMARVEAFLFFVTIFQTFSFCFPDGHPTPDTRGEMGIVKSPPQFDVIMTKRH